MERKRRDSHLIKFTKMHGLGNDFVVLDHLNEEKTPTMTPDRAAFLANRRLGVGCDQVVQLTSSGERAESDLEMTIYNSDGSCAEMCGNAVRCVTLYLKQCRHEQKNRFLFETGAGPIRSHFFSENVIEVEMGVPDLRAAGEKLSVGRHLFEMHEISMGNPHCVIFDDLSRKQWSLEDLGPKIEHHPRFPDRTNVEVVQVLDRCNLRMRVWERGAGITPACGTGACAAAVAAISQNLTEQTVCVRLDGGLLTIQWREGRSVVMRGPAVKVFHGMVALD